MSAVVDDNGFDHSTDCAVDRVLGGEPQMQGGGLRGLSGDSEPPGAWIEESSDERCPDAQSESLIAIRLVRFPE